MEVSLFTVMDAKDLRIEPVLGERNDSNASYSNIGASAPRSDKIKPLHEVNPTCVPKMDVQTVRPCAVIGPDRIIPQHVSTDSYLKKAQLDPWDYSENARKLPDYSKKVADPEVPLRNISPRQTFQESMHRITMPPRGNLTKLSENSNNYYSEKNLMLSENIKYNIPIDYEVPYNINTVNNDQRSGIGIPEMNVSQNNLAVMRNSHGWPMPVDSRQFVMPEAHHYAEYQNSSSRLVSVSHPLQTMHEDVAQPYADPYGRSGNVRYHPYPSSKHRFSSPRYDPHYSNRFDSAHFPPQHSPHKYSLQKTFVPNPYISYPQVPVKYLEPRIHEPHLDGYQRDPNHPQGFNLTYQGQSLLPNNNAGNCVTNKFSYLDNNVKPLPSGKGSYENANKVLMDPPQTKPISVNDHSFINDIRSNSSKDPMLTHYPPVNLNSHIPHYPPYYRNENTSKGYSYVPHYNNVDNNVNNLHPYTRIISTPHYSSTISHDSHASNRPFLSHNYGNFSQNSLPIDRNVNYYKNKYYNQDLRNHEYRYGAFNPMSSKQNMSMNNQPKTENKGIDVRQFLQMWNEGDEEHNDNKSSFTHPNDQIRNEIPNRKEELYVLGLVNVPNDELKKYDHIQKISKLPENIKGYNSFELLSQFEEVVEASNHTTTNSPILPVKPALRPSTIKQTSNNVVRPLSPLDVEAKITQSIIHKDCSFEIKPCSPKMLNVEIAAPAQSILNERSIEKVSNLNTKQLNINKSAENISIYKNVKHTDEKETNNISSCKMVKTSFSNDNSDHKSNYNISDLENNSGVCLASLPQLDTDIEFNFPEVNQQFLAANKSETSESIFDPQNCDTASSNNNINSMNNDNISNILYTSDKNSSKLSKFRKTKINTQESIVNNIDVQPLRKDSVIIKNPDNTEKCLDLMKYDNMIKNKDTSLNEKSLLSPINLSYNKPGNINNDFGNELMKRTDENYLNCIIKNCKNTETSDSSLSSCFVQSNITENNVCKPSNDLYKTTDNILAPNIQKENFRTETKNCQSEYEDQLELNTNFNQDSKEETRNDNTKIKATTDSESKTYVCDQGTNEILQNQVNLKLVTSDISEEKNISLFVQNKNKINVSENDCINSQNNIEHFEIDAELESMLKVDNLNFSKTATKTLEFITDHTFTKNNEISNVGIENCEIETLKDKSSHTNEEKLNTKDKIFLKRNLTTLETAQSENAKTTKDDIGNMPEISYKQNQNDTKIDKNDEISLFNHSINVDANKSSTELFFTKETSINHCKKIPESEGAINENNINNCDSGLVSQTKRFSTNRSSLKKELFSPRIQHLIYEYNWNYTNLKFENKNINSELHPKQEKNKTECVSNTNEKREKLLVKSIETNNSYSSVKDNANISRVTMNSYSHGLNTDKNKETIITNNNLNINEANEDIETINYKNNDSNTDEKKVMANSITINDVILITGESNVNNNSSNSDVNKESVKSNVEKSNLNLEAIDCHINTDENYIDLNIKNISDYNESVLDSNNKIKDINQVIKIDEINADLPIVEIEETIFPLGNKKVEIVKPNIQNAKNNLEAIDRQISESDEKQDIENLNNTNNISTDNNTSVKNLGFVEEKYFYSKEIKINNANLDVDNILLVDHSIGNIQLKIKTVSNNNEAVLDSNIEIQHCNKAIKNSELVQNKLKRSLSDSSIFSYNRYVHQNDTEIPWHSKRRRTNQCYNMEKSNVNFSRRNSTSTIKSDDIAVCIYISNDDSFVAQPESDVISNEICDDIIQSASVLNASNEVLVNQSINCESDNILTESIVFSDNENINLWVDDIACVETVVTDNNNINELRHEYSDEDTISEIEDTSCPDYIANYDSSDMYSENLNKYYCNKNIIADKIKSESPNVTLQHFYGLDNYSLKENILLKDNDDDINHNEYTVFEDHPDKFSNNIVGFELLSPLKNDIEDDESDDDVTKIDDSQDDTLHLSESSNEDSTLQSSIEKNTNNSSSPEVTSTTEEKKSGIFLKITNYKGSRVSIVDSNSRNIGTLNKENSYKFNYSDSKQSTNKPLITKAAKKYIPPLYDYQDFRVKLYLPLQKLIKLKQLKTAKDIPKTNPNNNKRVVQNDSKVNIRKMKPNFEDVLKSIDEFQFKQKNEKSLKKVIPKVVIKKNINGSHYASTSKTEFNPDLTGRKWQPWVFIEKNHLIDKMAIKNRRQAVYCHKKQIYTITQNIKPYKGTKYSKNVINLSNFPKIRS